MSIKVKVLHHRNYFSMAFGRVFKYLKDMLFVNILVL
jgi:hypothetical protein